MNAPSIEAVSPQRQALWVWECPGVSHRLMGPKGSDSWAYVWLWQPTSLHVVARRGHLSNCDDGRVGDGCSLRTALQCWWEASSSGWHRAELYKSKSGSEHSKQREQCMWKLWGRKFVFRWQSEVHCVWREVSAWRKRGWNEAGEPVGGGGNLQHNVRPVQEFVFCSTCSGKILRKCNWGHGLIEFILETCLLAMMWRVQEWAHGSWEFSQEDIVDDLGAMEVEKMLRFERYFGKWVTEELLMDWLWELKESVC